MSGKTFNQTPSGYVGSINFEGYPLQYVHKVGKVYTLSSKFEGKHLFKTNEEACITATLLRDRQHDRDKVKGRVSTYASYFK